MNYIGKLRPVSDTDLELMRNWRNAPEVRANMYTRHEITLEEHRAWWIRTSERQDQAYFMYEFEQRPLGIVGFTKIDTINRNCSWAFYSAPNAPRGTGSRMEFLAIEHVFCTLALHKLYCEVLGFNTAVIQMHEKFGFSVEGCLREHHKVDGFYTDIVLLAQFSDEWAKIRGAIEAKLIARLRSRV